MRYVYLHEGSAKYVFCLDNARFMNHTHEPNTRGVNPPDQPYGYDVATRDIAAGEELTCDYREFDGAHAAKLGGVVIRAAVCHSAGGGPAETKRWA